VEFEIAGLLAKCLSCGNDDFAPLRAHPTKKADRLACTECCTEVAFDDLRAQSGEPL
jgi:hypothetical protein